MRGFPECTTPFPLHCVPCSACLTRRAGLKSFLLLPSTWRDPARLGKVGVVSSQPHQGVGMAWTAACQSLVLPSLPGRVVHVVNSACCSPTNNLCLSVCIKTFQAKDANGAAHSCPPPKLGEAACKSLAVQARPPKGSWCQAFSVALDPKALPTWQKTCFSLAQSSTEAPLCSI